MKLFRSLTFAALLCSTSVAATETSGKLSKKSSRSDQQRLVALQMEATKTSNEAITSIESESESKSNKASNSNKKVENNMPPEPILERQPIQAQVILGNVDLDDLKAEEIRFFESALRKAIQLAQEQEHEHEGGQEDNQVAIGAILVENGHGTHQHDGRMLRGDRSLWSFSFFSVWTIIETFRCIYCPPDYDDDDVDHYEQWKEDMLTYTPAPTSAPSPEPSWELDDDYLTQWINERLSGGSGGGRRSLGVSESNTSLEDILCELLHEGPHECFHSVDKCTLEFSKW
mmetsp:Transcript_26571/g.64779  ORF Transcript_26571/g.64779 Transcript_26571/m.64779 type:complete len:287 (+) Transcript_26571:542-1402(+)